MSELSNSGPLKSLSRDKAFYFFTSIGNYTGIGASSLGEFVKKILDVDVKSLEFHLYRGDFEKWITETLEDSALASKIRQLKALKPLGIDLRDRLYLIVFKHYENLKKPASTQSTSTFMARKPSRVTFGTSQSNEITD
ncbi:MAG: DUF5752 family protein [Candidatus Bathyarchaeota archaeon]|nr:DUF5752 family protein [Candidatus Bathyarchaeota archaeon]